VMRSGTPPLPAVSKARSTPSGASAHNLTKIHRHRLATMGA
jgi:hypothetical protein